jgi:hypothetical protein
MNYNKEDIMKKMIGYRVAIGTCPGDMTDLMLEDVEDGYEIYGNLIVSNGEFHQAMIKYEESNET